MGPTYLNYLSPDDEAQMQIASSYSMYSGSFKGTELYDYGTMNDKVYYVRGGMEDWAYAASFDPDRVITCKPNTYGGYPPSKTQYSDATLRMFNTLVETSNHKTPPLLGNNDFSETNGHISRNIRLSLVMMDLVEPYIVIEAINGDNIPFDIVPTMHNPPIPITLASNTTLEITWNVRGALTVDKTFLIHSTPNQFHNKNLQELLLHEDPTFQYTESMKGDTIWKSNSFDFESKDYSFTASIDLSQYNIGDTVQIHAVALVDQSWTTQPKPKYFKPNIPPQSHLVNVRTNPNWFYETDDKAYSIQGRLFWLSIRLSFTMSSYVTPEPTTATKPTPPTKKPKKKRKKKEKTEKKKKKTEKKKKKIKK